MIHPLPPGTRDVLPDEMRELRALSATLRAAFDEAGYGEVRTPAFEYEEVLQRGEPRAAGAPYRLFDERGRILVLRSDMTVPIARMVASRYADEQPPFRLAYFTHAFRAVEPGRGDTREFLQGGVELVGMPAPGGDAEVMALVLRALERAGLRRHRLALGHGAVFERLLAEAGVAPDAREPLLDLLWRGGLVDLELRLAELGLDPAARALLAALPTLRGGPEVLERARGGPAQAAVEELLAVHARLSDRGLADRVIFDLGLVRSLGYYTGPVFEVYDPAVGFPLGGGGRYDELCGRFGRPLPACGAALNIERVHVAQAAEEALAR